MSNDLPEIPSGSTSTAPTTDSIVPPPRVFASPTENPNSPYYIHSSDNPATQVIFEIFNGANYPSWLRAVLMSMQVKNKTTFIDGTLVIPEISNDIYYSAWLRVNSLVLAWVLHSISPNIRSSLLYITNPRDLWIKMQARYVKSDGPRVFHLEKCLSVMAKGSMTITEYYNHFKTIWDEFISYRPLVRCTCGLCTCNLTPNLEKLQESDAVLKFLLGLDESYASLRSQLLLNSPLPSLARVFSYLLQEESSRSLTQSFSSSPFDTAAALALKKSFPKNTSFNKDKKKVVCTHCDYTNHTVDKFPNCGVSTWLEGS